MAADTRFDLAGASAPPARWPELPWRDWEPTLSTLHMWVQIVGKVRLALAPPLNHWWHVPLYVTARGLTTSPIPYGDREFQVDFDFVDHRLQVTDGDPGAFSMALEPRSVARFYREFLAGLRSPRHRRRHLPPSGGGRRRHPVRSGRGACLVRPAPRAAAVAGVGPGRPRAEGLPDGLRRQGQPGPLLLGRLRSDDDALLGPTRHRAIRAASPTARTGSWRRPSRTRM